MGNIFFPMSPSDKELYDNDSKSFPWLASIKMSDDEFLQCIERDLGKGTSALLFFHSWRKHYGWVFVAILKHFYETGEFVNYDYDYIDGQADYQVRCIMIAWGADADECNLVLDGKKRFDFSKHTAPSNVPSIDMSHYKESDINFYYLSHGFECPF